MSLLKELQIFVDRFALFFERRGLSRTQGRIIGYLSISEESMSSLEQISDFLNLSVSTISPELKFLVDLRLVERVHRKDTEEGGRGYLFKVDEDTWINTVNDKGQSSRMFTMLANEGLEILKDENDDRKKRLEDMKSLFTFLDVEMTKLMDKYHKQKLKKMG